VPMPYEKTAGYEKKPTEKREGKNTTEPMVKDETKMSSRPAQIGKRFQKASSTQKKGAWSRITYKAARDTILLRGARNNSRAQKKGSTHGAPRHEGRDHSSRRSTLEVVNKKGRNGRPRKNAAPSSKPASRINPVRRAAITGGRKPYRIKKTTGLGYLSKSGQAQAWRYLPRLEGFGLVIILIKEGKK